MSIMEFKMYFTQFKSNTHVLLFFDAMQCLAYKMCTTEIVNVQSGIHVCSFVIFPPN